MARLSTRKSGGNKQIPRLPCSGRQSSFAPLRTGWLSEARTANSASCVGHNYVGVGARRLRRRSQPEQNRALSTEQNRSLSRAGWLGCLSESQRWPYSDFFHKLLGHGKRRT